MDGPLPSRAHIVTFTDLVYAALAAYGLSLFNTALDQKDYWAVVYLGASAVWLFYDWYANHYFAIEQRLGGRNIPLDAVSFVQYAGLLYAASKTSAWILFFLAVRAGRGLVYNVMSLWEGKGPRDAARLRSYNYSSGFMLATYAPLFIYELHCRRLAVGVQFACAVGIWAIAYVLSIAVEARFDAGPEHVSPPPASQPTGTSVPAHAQHSSRRVINSAMGVALAVVGIWAVFTRRNNGVRNRDE